MLTGVFPTVQVLDLGNISFIHLFLTIPFNLDHKSVMHNIIYNIIPNTFSLGNIRK